MINFRKKDILGLCFTAAAITVGCTSVEASAAKTATANNSAKQKVESKVCKKAKQTPKTVCPGTQRKCVMSSAATAEEDGRLKISLGVERLRSSNKFYLRDNLREFSRKEGVLTLKNKNFKTNGIKFGGHLSARYGWINDQFYYGIGAEIGISGRSRVHDKYTYLMLPGDKDTKRTIEVESRTEGIIPGLFICAGVVFDDFLLLLKAGAVRLRTKFSIPGEKGDMLTDTDLGDGFSVSKIVSAVGFEVNKYVCNNSSVGIGAYSPPNDLVNIFFEYAS